MSGVRLPTALSMSITNINELGQLDATALREYVEGNKTGYTHLGLPVVEFDDEEYTIAFSDDVADDACKEEIKDSLWAFNSAFLSDMCGMPMEVFDCMAKSNLYDGANAAILACIEQTCGIDEFVESAIAEDGRGHFLNYYDGKEIELTNSNAYAYRIN